MKYIISKITVDGLLIPCLEMFKVFIFQQQQSLEYESVLGRQQGCSVVLFVRLSHTPEGDPPRVHQPDLFVLKAW